MFSSDPESRSGFAVATPKGCFKQSSFCGSATVQCGATDLQSARQYFMLEALHQDGGAQQGKHLMHLGTVFTSIYT